MSTPQLSLQVALRNDMASSFVSIAEVTTLVADVNAAAEIFTVATDGDARTAIKRLQDKIQKLLHSLEEPNMAVWRRIYQINTSAAIEVVSNLKLWNKFEGGRTISLEAIVEETKADEIMIIRIFRQLTAAGILIDTPGPTYQLTTLGLPYLNADHRAFNSFLFTEILPIIQAMPRTLAERAYKAPTKESGTPYAWANGQELWTYLGGHPDRAQNMVAGMKSLSTGNLAGDAYPWSVELAKLDIKDDEIVIVDIAGGQGHIMEPVRKQNPEMKGRIIVQDLPSTFEAVDAPPAGVMFMPYDIFTPQPVKNASIYYYRHIFHDWSDGDCSSFLQQLVPLLKEQPKSKLLLVDLVLPDINVGIQESIRDLSMFPIGGLERNEKQWKELLAKNGLGIKTIWRGAEPEACVECELL